MNNNEMSKQPFFSEKRCESLSIDDHLRGNRVRAPLYERLIQYAQSGNRSYHVPGHKNGAAYELPVEHAAQALSMDYMRELLRLDVTEIQGTDDLHHPEGVIQEGQELAARCFGAEETYWLVGGSTSGNLALLLSVCQQPGDLIIVQRNVHKSVIHGLMLAGAQAVFLTPEIDTLSGLAVVPLAETVRQALVRYPQARGVLVTSPNYYGMGSDLSTMAQYCHEHGIPLLVDEAHGAHYGHHPRFPQSALAAGADGVVQSTHKMLSAMTMGAMLHIQGNWMDRDVLRQRLAMIQSSSPSYPIMASLDLSRYWLDYAGSALFEQGLAARDYVADHLASIGYYSAASDHTHAGSKQYVANEQVDGIDRETGGRFAIVGEQREEHRRYVKKDSLNAEYKDCVEEVHSESRLDIPAYDEMAQRIEQDPFKIVLYDRTGYLSGQQLQQQLEQYGCIPEMSDERYVVLVFSLGSQMEDATRLLDALRRIADDTAIAAQEYVHAHADNVSMSRVLSALSIGKSVPSDALDKSSIAAEQQDADSNLLIASLISEPVSFQMKPIAQQQIETIPLEQAAGRRCAEMVIPYPPGIPVLYAGEMISMELHARLLQVRQHGMKIQGAADASLQSIRVYHD
ncbi:aminotransferase class I/II-fold pyridoxal phosphate-dependent enzyme [Paenibacillus hunanensis]|uniref:aminotransferase class I/II-fold pyridoxal phosphate-dependent enzyme n=1 Tax=Paenibacillus hunanensis TaxID=539262 RepID=UPI003D6B7368